MNRINLGGSGYLPRGGLIMDGAACAYFCLFCVLFEEQRVQIP